MRLRPVHAVLVVAIVIAGVLGAQYFLDGGAARASYIQVRPDETGSVEIPVNDLTPGNVRFYRFLNRANQEIDFFVGRDAGGTVQAGFDASEVCMKKHRGFRHEGELQPFVLRSGEIDGYDVILVRRQDGSRPA